MNTARPIKAGLLAASVLASMFLCGCTGNSTAVESKSTPAAPSTDTSFSTFFQNFASDSVFQSQHLAEQVRSVIADLDLDTDPPGTEEIIKPAEWKFNNLTQEFIQKEEPPFLTRVERMETGRVDFRMFNDGLGADMRYKFRFKDGRWELFEFRDDTDRSGAMDEAMMEEIE